MNTILSKIGQCIWRWGPPVALMSTIFYLSSKQNLNVSDQDWIDFVVFKSLHIIEYAVLYLLFLRAYYLSVRSEWAWTRITLASLLSALAFGALDELHQTFVPTRTGSVRDIVIDFIGIFIPFLYTRWYQKQIRAILI